MLYIQERQAAEMKFYVSQADPIIKVLTQDMNSNLDNMATLLTGEECELAASLCIRQGKIAREKVAFNEQHCSDSLFCSPPNGSFLVSPETAQMLIASRQKLGAAKTAIESAKTATDQLLKAHNALLSALQQQTSLEDEIEQIYQFVDAVSKANAAAKASGSNTTGTPTGGATAAANAT